MHVLHSTKYAEAARIADECGAEYVMFDLCLFLEEAKEQCRTFLWEYDYDTEFDKNLAYLKDVRSVLKSAELAVRISQWSDRSSIEIDKLVEAGVDCIFLPYATTDTAEKFLSAVNHRAKTVVLFDTKKLVESADEVMKLGLDGAYIDTRELMREYGKTYMNEVLLEDEVLKLCKKLKTNNIPFGIGIIGAMGTEPGLNEIILEEFWRLGASATQTQYYFCLIDKYTNLEKGEQEFKEQMAAFRRQQELCEGATADELAENRKTFENVVQWKVNLIEIEKMYAP